MKSKKLIGIILSVAGISAIIAAIIMIVTSLGDKQHDNKPSIHSLSANEAVSLGLSNMFEDITGANMTAEGTDATITINFNELELLANIKSDIKANKYSITASAYLNSVERFYGEIFADGHEITGYIPTLFDGTIYAPYEEVDTIELPDFDYKSFAEGLIASIREAMNTASDNITVNSHDMKAFADGEYYCYKAVISVEDLANIAKAGILYTLNHEELLEYIDTIYSSMDIEDDELSEDLYFDYSIDISTQMSTIAMMLDIYWPTIVTELEAILGSNIEFTVYLTEDVNIAGYELCAPNLFYFQADLTEYTEDGEQTAYYDLHCYDGDITLLDIAFSISYKELTTDIEKPSVEPVISLDQLIDEEMNK